MNKTLKFLKKYGEISLGVLLLDIGYYFFLEPTSLVTGGIMGISIIVDEFLPFPPSVFILICNVITLLLGLIFLGREFFLNTVYATLLSPLIVMVLEFTCPTDLFLTETVEAKYLLACVCGAVLVALGIGLTFRNNGCTGGMDVIQKIMVKYLHIPYSKTLYFTDYLIVLLGGFTFGAAFSFDFERIFFGVVCVVITGFIVDYVSLNGRARRTAYIITNRPEDIKAMIFSKIDRGVTEVDVRGGFTGDGRTMLICTMDKSEAFKMSDDINKVDPEAFTFFTSAKEVRGNYDAGKIRK